MAPAYSCSGMQARGMCLSLLCLAILPTGESASVTCAVRGQSYAASKQTVNGAWLPDAAACQVSCSNLGFCDYFTWHADSGACFLVGAKAKVALPDAKAVSGPKHCPPPSTDTPQTDPKVLALMSDLAEVVVENLTNHPKTVAEALQVRSDINEGKLGSHLHDDVDILNAAEGLMSPEVAAKKGMLVTEDDLAMIESAGHENHSRLIDPEEQSMNSFQGDIAGRGIAQGYDSALRFDQGYDLAGASGRPGLRLSLGTADTSSDSGASPGGSSVLATLSSLSAKVINFFRGNGQNNFGAGVPWKDAKVLYCYDQHIAPSSKEAFKGATRRISEAVPGITFTDVGLASQSKCSSQPAIYVTSSLAGCFSELGMINWGYPGERNQQLNLQAPGCDDIGTTTHEVLHALGMDHEQSRPDRDEYVQIHNGNIRDGKQSQFAKEPLADVSRPYDILSLMHYSPYEFSKQPGVKPTITIKDEGYEVYTNNAAEFQNYRVGQRMGMSKYDTEQLGALYNCNAAGTSCSPPQPFLSPFGLLLVVTVSLCSLMACMSIGCCCNFCSTSTTSYAKVSGDSRPQKRRQTSYKNVSRDSRPQIRREGTLPRRDSRPQIRREGTLPR